MLCLMKRVLPYLLLIASVSAPAQSKRPEPDGPPPPPLPSKATEPAPQEPLPVKKIPSDQSIPTISIRTDEKGQLVEEYRINGQLYMMRVSPKKGAPYYLLDSDGDGNLETSPVPGEQVQPVYWKLFEWQ